MNWHKTNLALILILCIIDIFLAIFLYNAYKKTELVPDNLIVEATENLAMRGITFDKETIDTKKHQKYVYLYSSDISFAKEMKEDAKNSSPSLISAITFLSGISENVETNSIKYFDIPTGTSVSVTDGEEKVLGSAAINGITGFEYTSAGFDSEKVAEIIKKDKIYADCSAKAQKLPSVIKSFFEKTYGGTVSGKAVHISEYDGGKVVTSLLCADGVYVHNMILSFYIKNNEILYVEGNMFFDEPTKDTDTRITDGINILFNLPENTDGDIYVTSQHLEYTLFEASSKQNYLVPSWIITYISSENTNEEKHIILNAITGSSIERVLY